MLYVYRYRFFDRCTHILCYSIIMSCCHHTHHYSLYFNNKILCVCSRYTQFIFNSSIIIRFLLSKYYTTSYYIIVSHFKLFITYLCFQFKFCYDIRLLICIFNSQVIYLKLALSLIGKQIIFTI